MKHIKPTNKRRPKNCTPIIKTDWVFIEAKVNFLVSLLEKHSNVTVHVLDIKTYSEKYGSSREKKWHIFLDEIKLELKDWEVVKVVGCLISEKWDEKLIIRKVIKKFAV